MSWDIWRAIYEYIYVYHFKNYDITSLFKISKYNAFLYLSFNLWGILLF